MKDLTVKYFVNVGQVKFPSPQLDSNSAGDLDYFFVSCFPHAEHSFTSLLNVVNMDYLTYKVTNVATDLV